MPPLGAASGMTETRIGEFVTVTREGAIATVRFDRGDGRNPLSRQLMLELTEAARSFADDLVTQAVVLTGKSAFSAGADLKDPAFVSAASTGLLERRYLQKVGPAMCDAWEQIEQLTICAIEKYCVGGGAALAAACDFRVVGSSAHFRLPEIPLGFNMSWHSIPRLVTLMGPARCKRFAIFGERLEAKEALAWGLADEIAADGETLAAAIAWAEKAAKLPPNALRMTKQSVNASANALHQATSFMDLDQFALTASSEDCHEAVSAFLDRREPKFTGR